ncbi:Uncharacterized protein DBV15_10857, partial [Temnothorax longispinosus]
MQEVLADNSVRITRPSKRVEVRVGGLDDSADVDEMRWALSAVGQCSPGEVDVGTIRGSLLRMGSAWARCPVAAAKKAVVSGLTVGWVKARVELLLERQVSGSPLPSAGLVDWLAGFGSPAGRLAAFGPRWDGSGGSPTGDPPQVPPSVGHWGRGRDLETETP